MESLKVLVVDDESRMRKLVKDFLSVKGFQVIEAADGEEAVDIFFNQKDITLILLDVMMPRMDGWEVLKTIRQYSQVPIIMLTARAEERDSFLGVAFDVIPVGDCERPGLVKDAIHSGFNAALSLHAFD